MAEHSPHPVLQIADLTIAYRQNQRWLEAVRDVNLQIESSQTYGLVGESGSGKSTLALAIMRYLSENGAVRRGTITLAGQDLMALTAREMRQVWRSHLKLVPQNALSGLNPSLRIGQQVAECLDESSHPTPLQGRVIELLSTVRLADPTRVAESYPHELSGGMQQRVMIAMALSAEPQLLVLDEPTTSLDVTTEAAILDLVADLIRQRSTAVLFVSHNLGIVARICDRVAVLYAGELVEDAAVAELYRQPLHPYTQGLLGSVPRMGHNKSQGQLQPIPGSIPQLDQIPDACVFAPRCPLAIQRCRQERPSLDTPMEGRKVRCHRWPEILSAEISVQPDPASSPASIAQETPAVPDCEPVVLKIDGLSKGFTLSRTVAEMVRRQIPRRIRAVDGVDLQIRRGRTLGLVGESGSGKTTLARCVIGLTPRSEGKITLLDIPLARSLEARDTSVLRHLQMVFQNPEEALNPYLTVGETLRRPLLHLRDLPRSQVDAQIGKLLASVNLHPNYAHRLPAQLSGGEKQRVAIARAFASQPELLIFDESVSALDVSVQASILNLLHELQQGRQSAYLFITHDLGVVSYLADDIAVIYLGHLMEIGPAEALFEPPHHPYTEALLSAIPLVDPAARQAHIRLEGDIPSPTDVPGGCRFHTRCPRFLGPICVEQEPPWQEEARGYRIYCHIPLQELKETQRRVLQ